MDVDKGLYVVVVLVGKETLEKVLLDNGSELNFITWKERSWLELQTSLLPAYWLPVAAKVVVQLVQLISIAMIYIHSIPYLINLIVI